MMAGGSARQATSKPSKPAVESARAPLVVLESEYLALSLCIHRYINSIYGVLEVCSIGGMHLVSWPGPRPVPRSLAVSVLYGYGCAMPNAPMP